ncbi:MAG TPA: hypothetical protein GXX62_11135 [Alcaligenaceae bacterium]|nr:hypothetical protein [Alcaligenaceae bacterium]
MRWLAFLFFSCFSFPAWPQLLPVFHDLPVQWLAIEQWHWQGQPVASQRFKSQHAVVEVAQQIQQRLEADLLIQRLPSAWLLSFEHSGAHYLILLSALAKGSEGWLSSLVLKPTLSSKPPVVFDGLYQHSWVVQPQDLRALYVVLQPNRGQLSMRTLLQARLKRQGWSPESCAVTAWCDWQNGAQRMRIWIDSSTHYWHVIWWPKA